ncbi:hypothetical protein KBZ21_42095, partial [Streptomyces sp. A73]|nr:hypothetical protein [Streptomyces sp. A73]
MYDGYSIPADSLVIEDYEAPLGAPIYYSVLTLNADGTGSEYRTTDTVILDPGDPNYVWLTDPARPGVGL